MTIYVAARADAHLGTTHFAFARSRRSAGLRQFSAAWYAPGSRVECGYRDIPQVGETYAVVGVESQNRWGFEAGVNEHALAVAHEAIATREPAELQPGLGGDDLTRLGLERGRNAREALEVVAALVERFGHAAPSTHPSDRNDYRFLFADPSEAWCLECAGRRWAARRVTRRLGDTETATPEIRDDWEITAKGLAAYAREHCDWEGAARLDFGAVFGSGPSGPGPPPESGGFSMGDVVHRLRTVAAASASLGVALPHDRQRPWPLWVCAGPAAVGVQLPVYVDVPLPTEAGEPSSAFEALASCSTNREDLLVPRLREAWKGFEAALEGERRQVEREATELAATKRRPAAQRVLALWSADLWARAEAQARELAAALPL